MLARFGGFLDDRGMRKETPLIVLLVLFLLPTTAVGAAPKVGAVCSKNNLIKNDGQFKYTCTKSGSKLIWKKSPKIITEKPSSFTNFSKTYSTDDGYHTLFEGGPCQIDNTLPANMKLIEDYFSNFHGCAGQLQVAKYSLGNKRPVGTFEFADKFSTLNACKITNDSERFNLSYIGPNSRQMERRFPSPKTVIQLIPIYSTDTEKPVNSPKSDYGHILDFFKEWIDYSSDFGSTVTVRFPDSYIKMQTPVTSYELQHNSNRDQPSLVKFSQDLITAADPIIDFTGANIAIIVPPPGTDTSVMGQAGIRALSTSEGNVPNVMTEFGLLAKNPRNSSPSSSLGHPFWWIHEIMHAGIGFGDRYGDGKKNLNTDYGMGELTLMTPWGGDFTTWEKWNLGFMQDSQIQCKTDIAKSTHWIAPSTVQTKESKSLIIPISQSKAIVVETLRPGGLYYKIPIKSQGALVYEIDLTLNKNGYGMKVSLPSNRAVENFPFFMASAPLKVGESTTTNGFRISVTESGTFGDLITVEKVQ
jgi:hypothetical protein